MNKIRDSKQDRLINAFIILSLVLCLIVVIYPFYFVIIASISEPNAVFNGQVIFAPVKNNV